MSVPTPRREPFAAPPDAQTRTGAGTTLHAQLDRPAGFRHARANCGSCGEAWFGDVAYCPYCGRPSSASAPVPAASDASPEADSDGFGGTTHALAGYVRSSADKMHSPVGTLRAGAMRLFGAPAGAGAEQPGMGWKAWAKVIALATVLVAVVFAVGELATTARDRPGPQDAMRAPGGDAARSGTVEANVDVAASAPAAPRAEAEPPAQQPAPAPPARNRSLCSAANEAAGLCSPQ